MTKLTHLNCGTMRPYGLFPFSTIPLNNTGSYFGRGFGVIHCLLLETEQGLILIDSGYGLRDYSSPTPFVLLFNKAIGLDWNPEQTVYRQLERLGFHPEQVRHIFLTHMHLDHSGGLPDFPQAVVHVYEVEQRAALEGSGISSMPFIEQHWAHGPAWQTHRLQGELWQGLERTPVVRIDGLEFFFVPMVGHSPGHCMVVVGLPGGRWVVHAGDTYGYHGQIDPDQPHYPPHHRLFRPLLLSNRISGSMFAYDEKLQQLGRALGDQLTIFCAHDPHEFMRLAGTAEPA